MDAYKKMLVKIYEISGGKENFDVDFVDLTKREGYYSNIDSFLAHLKGESWITELRPNVVRITHWGVAEARKVGSVRPDADRAVERESKRLLNASRELGVVIEEYISDTSSERFASVEAKFVEMKGILGSLRDAR